MSFKAGDWVEVRSKEEILRTLDGNARLDAMPFMPEMLQFCGKRFQVQARAHKTCDPIYTYATRSIPNAVHLSTRCDGKAHGGCQTACLLFWKEAWLKPVASATAAASPEAAPPPSGQGCTEAQVYAAARVGGDATPATADTQYVCQTTHLCDFSKQISCWDPKQYVEDYTSGNTTLMQLLRGGFYVLLGRRFESSYTFLRRFYNGVQALTGGMASPSRNGTLPNDRPWPLTPLNLQPGELVRVKSHDEILATLKSSNFHKGLYFDVEMVPYCGGTYRVKSRVDRFLDEKTGVMRALKTPALILENVWCTGQYSKCRMYCPRALHSWWREEWLERVADTTNLADIRAKSVKSPARESVGA